MLHREIPSSGELLPVIGLGTWIQFDLSHDAPERKQLIEVLETMRAAGATLIDSSPMYGRSEKVVGDLTSQIGEEDFFYATKVWTTGREEGIQQIEDSFRKMRREKMDLLQIHNLVDLKTHLRTLRSMKEEGRIRYIGITHYQSSSHDELERIIKNEKIDFIQFNYSIGSRNAERSLLPAARDHGVAVIINEPLEKGKLFAQVKNKELPEWAVENDMHTWSEFFLKYILSNDAVNCVIPGTSNPKNMLANLRAGEGSLPDENLRKKMVELIEQ
jgi:diketogulonate reductase-like aldo/keto reductase